MSWIALKLFFRRLWVWCKKYWQLLVGASVPLIAWIIFRNRDTLDSVLARVRDDHQREIDIIDESRDKERRLVAEAQKRHDETIAAIEADHERAQIELDDKKKKRIRDIVSNHRDNPEEITRRLSALTGIRSED